MLVIQQALERLRRLDRGAVVHEAHVAGVEGNRAVERVEQQPLPHVVESLDLAALDEQVVVERLVDAHQVFGGEPDVEVGVDRHPRTGPLDVVVHLVVRGRPLQFGVDARLERLLEPLTGTHRRRVDEATVGRDRQGRGLLVVAVAIVTVAGPRPVGAVITGGPVFSVSVLTVRRLGTTPRERDGARRAAEREEPPAGGDPGTSIGASAGAAARVRLPVVGGVTPVRLGRVVVSHYRVVTPGGYKKDPRRRQRATARGLAKRKRRLNARTKRRYHPR